MDRDRTEQAVQRIEAALARISKQADTPATAPVSELVNRHEDLRDSVAASLKELDGLIERLQK